MKRVLIAALLLSAPTLRAQTPAPAASGDVARAAAASAEKPRTYDLTEVDVRPVPLNMEAFAAALRHLYPPELRDARVQGTVYVQMVVTEQGRVEEVEIIRTADSRLNAASLKVIDSLRFQPGRVGGQAVRTRLTLPIQWSVSD
ncbi:energy transducer TonB [Longimicrobium sp.]|uniref:energy transducer TonB n=1 Tax=Longimicrobium sp. TaxID=2029185 RepID=UPI002E332E17|nr:energy transducer TonB [Longimicrobium sp.]HEX6038735.1 energy transducer TonB [Longimicrobium sp.]